jgi:hypothetical protein
MLMTAEKAAEMFTELAQNSGKDSYVLVFWADITDETAAGADALDGGDGCVVEEALATYIEFAKENIPSPEEDKEDTDE